MLILSRTKVSRLLSIIRLTMLCYSTSKAVEIGLQYQFARDVRDVRSMRHEQLWPSSLFPEQKGAVPGAVEIVSIMLT